MFQYASIMFLAGIGIPLLAALNAALGARMGSPSAAALILFVVAFSAAAAATLITGPHALARAAGAPKHLFLAGFFVAFYVLSVTYIAPHFGVGNAVFFVLIGQLRLRRCDRSVRPLRRAPLTADNDAPDRHCGHGAGCLDHAEGLVHREVADRGIDAALGVVAVARHGDPHKRTRRIAPEGPGIIRGEIDVFAMGARPRGPQDYRLAPLAQIRAWEHVPRP